MTTPDGEFDDDAEDDRWREAAHMTDTRDRDADEADLIEQAIAVPDDDSEFDR